MYAIRSYYGFKISTDKIVAFGASAGAFHWAQTITWENDDAFFQTDPEIDDHVDAAVLRNNFV